MQALTWICGDPRRWISSALSLEYLWLVADCMASTASRHLWMASPGGREEGDTTWELIRSNSFEVKWKEAGKCIHCWDRMTREGKIIKAHKKVLSMWVHTINFEMPSDCLPVAMCAIYYLEALKSKHLDQFEYLVMQLHRRGYQ